MSKISSYWPVSKPQVTSVIWQQEGASKEVVPVDLGNLKNTGTTHPPVLRDGRAVVVLSYGGPGVDYAVIQHETEHFKHEEGQTWKYLERPAHEAVRGMGQRIASYVRSRLEREAAK